MDMFRYGVNPTQGAACATAALEEVGLITDKKRDLVITR